MRFQIQVVKAELDVKIDIIWYTSEISPHLNESGSNEEICVVNIPISGDCNSRIEKD